MPNVKIYVDEALYQDRKTALTELLPHLREALCRELSVPSAACQLAVMPVLGLQDQPKANFEVQYLGIKSRTPQMIETACMVFQGLLADCLGHVPAVRATPLDPETYVALK